MKVWILTGKTDCAIEVGPFAFLHEPSDAEQLETIRKNYPSEFEDMSEEEEEENPWGNIMRTSLEECEVIP